VEEQIKTVESGVLERIQGSTNLQELDDLLCREKGSFGIELENMYEQNKREMEGSVQKGQFSAVVSKKEHYDSLIKQMQTNNDKMQKAVEEGQRKIERIISVKRDQETHSNIGKRLHEIVDSCLEIDIRNSAMNLKRQRLESEQRDNEQAKLDAQRQEQARVEAQRQAAAAASAEAER